MSKLDRFKLETSFLNGAVTHTTYRTDLATGQRKTPVQTTWTDLRTIGSGGFGIVILQEADVRGKLRAVKKILKGLGMIDYSRELKVLSKAADWQDLFVRFLGWYENVDFIFIAMEYIEYGDLSQYLRTAGALSPSDARDITRQLLEGLAVLHEMKICHRDLKPQNVLIASRQPIWVKLSDFGVSKSSKGTVLHTRIGSQGYFAPEMLGLLPVRDTKNTYTNAVDIWALGCIVHELLTAEIPFLEIEDFDTGFSGLTQNPSGELDFVLLPQTDVTILKDFCDGTIGFPTDSLRRCKVNNEAVDFVRTLLVADPKSRATAKEALQSAWLTQEEELGIDSGHVNNLVGSPESPAGVGIVSTPELSLLWLPTPRIPTSQAEKTGMGVEVDSSRVEYETEVVKASHVIRTSANDGSWNDGAIIVQGELSRLLENRSSTRCGQPSRGNTGDGGTGQPCRPLVSLFHTDLAQSYRTLGQELEAVDKALRTSIAITIETITNMVPETRSWKDVVAVLEHNPCLRLMGDTIHKSDKYDLGQSDSISDIRNNEPITLEMGRLCFTKCIGDRNVSLSTVIDQGWFESIACPNITTDKHIMDNLSPSEKVYQGLVDIGVLRYPKRGSPYIKVFRMELDLWAETKQGSGSSISTKRGMAVGKITL